MQQIETFEGETLSAVRDAINERLAGKHRAVSATAIHIAPYRTWISTENDEWPRGPFRDVTRWYGWIEISTARRDLATEAARESDDANSRPDGHTEDAALGEDTTRPESGDIVRDAT